MTIQAALDQQRELESFLDTHPEVSIDFDLVQREVRSGYSRPLLVLDLEIVRQKYRRFREAMPRVTPHYAVKANPDERILRALDQEGCNFEVASIAELDLLLGLSIEPDRIYYSNPVKSRAFIRYAAEKGLRWFAFDSADELIKISEIVPDAKLYLRFDTPNIGSDWPLAGKFGAKQRDIEGILDVAVEREADVCGLTFHVGSQCRNVENWRHAIGLSKKIFDMMKDKGLRAEMLNIGGGYPVRLTRPIPSVEYIGEVVSEALNDISGDISICAEPGRFMVSDAAYFVCQVIGTQTKGDERWLYLDAGVFGGLMECTQGIQYEIGADRKDSALVPWFVAGPSCDSVDMLPREQMLPADTQEGDFIFFPKAGAYTTVYANEFNGFPLPEVRVINE